MTTAGADTGARAADDGMSVRSLFWNTGLNYASFLILSLSGFVLTPLILSHVGDSRMGLLTLSTALTGYVAVLDLGLGQATMKAIARLGRDGDRTGLSQLTSSVFGFFMLVGAAILVLGLALTPLLPGWFHVDGEPADEFRATYVLSVLSVAFSFPQSVLTAVLQGMRDYAVQNLFVIGYTLVTFVGSIVLLAAGYGITALAALTLVAFLGQFALKALVVARRHGVRVRRGLMGRRHLDAVTATAGAIFVINLSAKVIFDTDVVVVGAILTPAAVAAYQVALSLGTILRRVGEQLNVITLTTSAALWAQGDRDRFARLYLEAMRVTGLVMFPAVAILFVVAPRFVELWVGADMAQRSVGTLLVLSVAMVAVALHTTATQVLIAADRHALVAKVAVAEAVANLALSVALGRLLGIVGVAIGTLVPTVVAMIAVSVTAASRTLDIPVRSVVRVLIWPAAQAIAAGLLGYRFAREAVSGLGMLALVGLSGVVFGLWLLGNVFGPAQSRARYRAVLPWH